MKRLGWFDFFFPHIGTMARKRNDGSFKTSSCSFESNRFEDMSRFGGRWMARFEFRSNIFSTNQLSIGYTGVSILRIKSLIRGAITDQDGRFD